jgi:hypothetical protein
MAGRVPDADTDAAIAESSLLLAAAFMGYLSGVSPAPGILEF